MTRRRGELLTTVMGVLWIVSGLPKFVAYGWELDAFERFGLPAAPVWVIVAGIVEIGGGILLLRRQVVAPVCVALIVTMAVAITVSGIKEGDVIPSLTVAPLFLLAMVVLLRRELRRGPPG